MILVEFCFTPSSQRTKESDSHLCKNGFDAKDLGRKLIQALNLNTVEISWKTSTTKENIIINKPKQL